MFCRNCGKEIIDEAVVCPYCGCLTGVSQPKTQENISIKADKVEVTKIVLSLVIPIVGIVLGVLDLKGGRKKAGTVYLIIGIVLTVIEIILGVIYLYIFLGMFLPFLFI